MAPSIGPGQGDANAPAMPWGQAMVRPSGRCHDLEKFAFLSPGMPRFGGSHRGGDPALRWFAAREPCRAERSRQDLHMEYFLQQLINGLTLGSIYGLIAIGYTMVYGIIGMINFAHGDVFMVGAFLALIAFLMLVALGVTAVPLALFLVLLIAMALTALYGWTVERMAYRPLRHSFRLAPLISAIGMSIVLQNYVQIVQGARVKPLPPLIQGGYTLLDRNGFAVGLSNVQIAIVVITLVIYPLSLHHALTHRPGLDNGPCTHDLD